MLYPTYPMLSQEANSYTMNCSVWIYEVSNKLHCSYCHVSPRPLSPYPDHYTEPQSNNTPLNQPSMEIVSWFPIYDACVVIFPASLHDSTTETSDSVSIIVYSHIPITTASYQLYYHKYLQYKISERFPTTRDLPVLDLESDLLKTQGGSMYMSPRQVYT